MYREVNLERQPHKIEMEFGFFPSSSLIFFIRIVVSERASKTLARLHPSRLFHEKALNILEGRRNNIVFGLLRSQKTVPLED
jgi:hypothetical protein